MFCMLKKKKIYPAYVSKQLKAWKKVITLIIPNGEGCLYLATKKVSALLWEITSKNNGEFYCLNYLHSIRTNLNHIKYMCK